MIRDRAVRGEGNPKQAPSFGRDGSFRLPQFQHGHAHGFTAGKVLVYGNSNTESFLVKKSNFASSPDMTLYIHFVEFENPLQVGQWANAFLEIHLLAKCFVSAVVLQRVHLDWMRIQM